LLPNQDLHATFLSKVCVARLSSFTYVL
jgi:hypothetical protein